MTRRTRSIGVVLVIVIAVLLIAYGAFVALVVRHTARHYEEESLQRLSYGLAGHIAEHWPEVADHARDLADQRARDALLTMLMTVNRAFRSICSMLAGTSKPISATSRWFAKSRLSSDPSALSYPDKRCHSLAPIPWISANIASSASQRYPPGRTLPARRATSTSCLAGRQSNAGSAP